MYFYYFLGVWGGCASSRLDHGLKSLRREAALAADLFAATQKSAKKYSKNAKSEPIIYIYIYQYRFDPKVESPKMGLSITSRQFL